VVITSYGIGPQVINDCITTNSLGGYYNPPLFPATISNIGYSGISCVCATTTSTTTTTTTLAIYTYLGGTNPTSASSVAACAAYSTIRGYLCLTTPLSSIGLGDIFYDSYPSSPTNGGNNWIALKTGGVGDAYTFQIDSSGVVIGVGGNCNATTTTTSTTTSTTTAAPLLANIDIVNGSLDIAISQVDFNGVPTTLVAGTLPNTTGNGTNLFTTQIGTYTLDVYKNNGVAGQHISVTDSVGGIQCIYFGSGSAVESYTNVVYDGVNPIQIDVQDGTCPTTIPLTWEWTNNNVVETPPFGGGYITISVNSIVVVNQLDSSSTTTTIYNGTISPNVGDVIDIFVYSYANNTYGTQTNLQVFSPLNNTLAAYIDSQPAAGSPSSLTYSFTATSNAINIIASSNSN
jgi:hypothetical protein